MTSQNKGLKLGVLNMTISFDTPKHTKNRYATIETPASRMHPAPFFIPKYRGNCPRNSLSIDNKNKGLSPFQSYSRYRKASIRYYREFDENSQKSAQVQALLPQSSRTNNKQFIQNFEESEPYTITSRAIRGNGLKYTINKGHLRTPDPQSSEKGEHFMFHMDKNPQQSMRGVFTVRPVKTSFRAKRQVTKSSVKYPSTRQQNRRVCHPPQTGENNVRPWSPARNIFNRETMFQSSMLQSTFPSS